MYVAIALSSWVVNDLLTVAGAVAEEEEEEEDGKSSGATARKAARTTRSAFSLNFFDESARTTRNDFECMMNADTRLFCICFDSISNHSASECREREREREKARSCWLQTKRVAEERESFLFFCGDRSAPLSLSLFSLSLSLS